MEGSVSPVATGTVYIVNTTNQLVALTLNYSALTELGPAGGRDTQYAPTFVGVPRSNANRIPDPVFAEENSFEVMFAGVRNSYQIKIELEKYPSNNNLLLHIFFNHLVLSDGITNAIIFNSPPAHLIIQSG
jgi:hypothetical protein